MFVGHLVIEDIVECLVTESVALKRELPQLEAIHEAPSLGSLLVDDLAKLATFEVVWSRQHLPSLKCWQVKTSEGTIGLATVLF